MKRFRLSRQARLDEEEIWLYIAQDNLRAADRQIDRFLQKYLLLGRNPRLGRPRDELQPGIRSFPVGNYVIFYRLTDTGIEIVRVLSGRRDIEALFR